MLDQGLSKYVRDVQASTTGIAGLGADLHVAEQVLLRVRTLRGNDNDEGVDIWFDVWEDGGKNEKVIFRSATLKELGFYVGHRSEDVPPFDPHVILKDPMEIFRTFTTPQAEAQHTRMVHENSRRIMEREVKPGLRKSLGKAAFAILLPYLDRYGQSVLRTELVAGDKFRGVTKFKSKAAAVLTAPFRMTPYPPNSLKHRVIVYELAKLVRVGILTLVNTNGRYAMGCFLVSQGESFRVVVNTAPVAKNIVAETMTKKRTIGAEIVKQNGFKYRIKQDLKGAFHLNELADDPDPEITQIRYGSLIFQANRTIMGEVNSAEFLNRALDEVFAEYPWLSRWADDILIGAKSRRGLARKFCRFLVRCFEHGVVLSIAKMAWGEEIFWCGTWFGKDYIKPDTFSQEIIWAIDEPRNGAELARCIGSVEWLSKFVPNCTKHMLPLRAVMERIYKHCGSRESKRVEKVLVKAFGWSEATSIAWREVKGLLIKYQKAAIRDPEKALILHCDASTEAFAGVLLQCPHEDLGAPPTNRRNELLECCGGTLTQAQRKWAIVELEGLAVIRSIHRFWHIIGEGSMLHIFTDNEALASIFDPDSTFVQQKDKPGQGRLIRWHSLMMTIPHQIKHIPGVMNTFADMLSRLDTYPPDRVPVPEDDKADDEPTPALFRRAIVSALHLKHNLQTVWDPDWVQPTIGPIHELCGKDGLLDADFARDAKTDGGVFDYTERVWKKDGRVIIPDADDLRLKLMIMAHCALTGHRGVEITLHTLESVVYWRGMRKDLTAMIQDCIHCCEKRKHQIERPFGKQLFPHSRNQIVSFDYIALGPSESNYEMLLLVTDKLTTFTRLYPATSENAVAAAQSLMDWISIFSVPATWLSDQSPSFKNQVMEELTKRLGVDHHFVTAYSSRLTSFRRRSRKPR
jgi:hypothetical protein